MTPPTRHATEAAIVYEDAGEHELKGKSETQALSRAVRVIALRGGELRSAGLESPFVGRDREFRQLKDLLHATAEDRKSHLVSVTGVAGIGKSRLSWELFKYIDGLVDTVWWHRGRCIPYGEGVTYWALAEMVRMRARIAEDEAPEGAWAKLRASIEEHVADDEDRRFIEPRLAHLLGLEDRTAPSREDLFAGCRMFFERMAERWPVALVFEDLHGRTRACWISSSTSWSGRGTTGCSWSPSRARSCWSGGRPGERVATAPRRCPSNRCPATRWMSSSGAWSRVCRTSSVSGSANAPRACPSTRSRPSGCSSIGDCSDVSTIASSRRGRWRT